MAEMGMDATSKQVDDLINTFDTDGDGVIALDEFYEIYAHTPIGHFDFSHVDSDRMRRIEQVVENDDGRCCWLGAGWVLLLPLSLLSSLCWGYSRLF